MEKRIIFDDQLSRMYKQRIQDAKDQFGIAMSQYNEDTVKVGGRLWASTWDARTFNARVSNSFVEALNGAIPNRPITASLEPLIEIQRWIKHLDGVFAKVQWEIKQLVRDLSREGSHRKAA